MLRSVVDRIHADAVRDCSGEHAWFTFSTELASSPQCYSPVPT